MKLLEIIKIVVYTLKITGLAPISPDIEKTGENFSRKGRKSVFRFSKTGLVYNFLFLILLQIIAGLAIPNLFSLNYPNNSPLTLAIDFVQGIACSFTTNVIIISWGFRQQTAASIMNKLLEIDRQLSAIEKEEPSNKKVIKFFAAQIIFNIFLLITFARTEAALMSEAFFVSFFFVLPILIIYLFILEYYLVVKLVAIKLERVNKNLSKLSNFEYSSFPKKSSNDYLTGSNLQSTDSQLTILRSLGEIRTRLSQVSQDIADFFSFPVLLSVGCFFYTLVYNLYFLISPILLGSNGNFSIDTIPNTISWILVSVYPLTLLTFNVTKATNEVMKKKRFSFVFFYRKIIDRIFSWTQIDTTKANSTGFIVHKLLASPMRREIKSELRQFSLQLLHERFSFTAYGFFELDCTMLHSILGATATYLVILIQFQQTESSFEYNSTVRTDDDELLCKMNRTFYEDVKECESGLFNILEK